MENLINAGKLDEMPLTQMVQQNSANVSSETVQMCPVMP